MTDEEPKHVRYEKNPSDRRCLYLVRQREQQRGPTNDALPVDPVRWMRDLETKLMTKAILNDTPGRHGQGNV